MTLCDLCDLLFKNVFGFFSVTVAEERRKIICTEDHKEETAGASQGFNPDHYTQFVGREAVAQRLYRLSGKASLAGANKIQPVLLYAVAWLPWVCGDCARMSSGDRSTLRKAM
jgi:hypothetical protein